ncbi:hypothetical protein HYH03_004274 [Edaphochlamys debaryana]|uniref:Uncharacterized protein n=1 Tax=Edaphochlamys debaryana TaxID=47281 RepID=A0A835Y8K9_9CHLO|nr:hypothetical protein HYH03_004274 [Edaphochlamys debaryana]|eukprot:KAG2498016.1 hypothetical protein HYH03_004274 [Edaphochlamys debaryana]
MCMLPKMQGDGLPDMLHYEVHRREQRGFDLHLHLRRQGRPRMPQDFDVSGAKAQPSAAQLHNMVQNDGSLEAAVVGALYGFHTALQLYNSSPRSQNFVVLTHGNSRILEYGIAMGSTTPDFAMVYHLPDGRVVRQQDPENHCWIYFKTERSDRVYLDVGSLPYGFGMMVSILDYLPDGTPEAQLRRMMPQLGAPACVLSREEVAQLEAQAEEVARHGSRLPPERRGVRKGYLADRRRFPVSSLPTPSAASDGPAVDPLSVVEGLLSEMRQEALAGEPGAEPGSGSRSGPGSGSAAAASSSARGERDRVEVAFRDGPLEEQAERAMGFFECAANNTTAVLQQGTYRRYPASLEMVRCFAPWVDLTAL